jgi:glucose-6-phosphate dehydrogenase assembly protein OpcA
METQESTSKVSVTKGVDAARLEKELARMWAEMSAPKGGGQAGGVVRACALNLVVYVAGREECPEVNDLLEDIVERHPCRAILIVADRAATQPRLEAFVSTRCQLTPRGSKQVCGEQVTIEADGPVVETASTAVAPLLVPDVPVFLWWKDIPHQEDKLFDHLAEMADRVVIDSASFDQPHKDTLRLAAILKRGGLRLSDLNWGRLTSWRSLVASFWDVSDYRDSLTQIVKVVIEYDPPDSSHEEIAPKALLALGWIASCLGWEVQSAGSKLQPGRAQFKLSDGGREVEAVLSATDDVAGRDGWITSLTLTTAAGDEFYVVLRMGEGRLETGARLGGSDGQTVGRVLAYEARSEGQRLSAELDILSRDEVYEKAALIAARMLEAAGA